MSWFTDFDPNPTWMILTLHIISILAGIIYIFGIICVLLVKRKVDIRYQKLLITGMTLNFLAQLVISTGCIPIIAFPFTGGFPAGFLSHLGIPTCAQISLSAVIIIMAGACTTLLFFYRHHILLPLSKTMTWIYLIVLLVGAVVIPGPLTASHCFINITEYKVKACSENPLECEKIKDILWESRTFVMYFSELNIHSVIVVYCILLSISMTISIGIFVWRIIFRLKSKMISEATRKIHKVLIHSLLALTVVQYTFFLIPAAACAACVLFSLPFPGLFQIAEISYSLSDPIGILAMIWWRKDYRKAIVTAFRKGICCYKQPVATPMASIHRSKILFNGKIYY